MDGIYHQRHITFHNEVFILYDTALYVSVPYGLAVRIPGFHPGGPGSTPGMGTFLFSFNVSLLPLCMKVRYIIPFISLF